MRRLADGARDAKAAKAAKLMVRRLHVCCGGAAGRRVGFSRLLFWTLNCMGVTVSNWLWYAVIGVLSAAVAAIIAWYISCAISWCPCAKKCDWLVITGIATLIGGIIAGYLSGCCPWMKYVSSGLLAVALAVFIYWCVHCKPSLCDVFAKLLVAFASGAAVALAYLALLPALAACGITWVGVAVTTTAALLAIAVANCH